MVSEFHTLGYTGGQLRFLTPDGIVYEDFPFRPYCYIRRGDLTDEVLFQIADIDESATLEEVEDYYQGELYKINFSSPYNVRLFKDANVESLQSDVPFPRRVLIDMDWRVTPTEDVLIFDIEVDSSEGFPNPENAYSRILTICCMDTTGNEYVLAYDDEKQTLQEFFDLAEKYKCIMGWNSQTFDKPYIENRADRLNVDFNSFKYVHIDALPVYRDILLIGRSNYKLETVISEEFEDEYYDFPDVDYEELLTYFENDRERLIEYNLEDVRAVRDIEKRYRLKDLVFDILAGDGYCRPEDIFYVKDQSGYKKVEKSATVLVEGIILNESDDVIWPNKYQGTGEEKFQGADVLDPTPGLHENVIVLDFSSMYPGIIEALNVGPETFREDGSGDIDAPIGSFVSEPESKFVTSYRRAQKRRNEWKVKKKERTQGTADWYVASAFDTGLKARTNTFYGVIGSRYSRFYNKNVAENITRMGAMMIQKTKELSESYGVEVLYGDTDSVLIRISEGDPVTRGKALATTLTAELKTWIEDEFNANSDFIELSLDDVYSSFFMTDKKKRYAGRKIWAGTPCDTFDITGFEVVRGDTMEAVAEFQEELLRRLVDGENPTEIVHDYRRRLKSGELDDKLVTYVSLSKPIDQYNSTPPHVRLAKRHDFGMGDEIPYVKYGSSPKDVVLADDEYRTYLTQSAYNYIWENKFEKIVDRLGIDEGTQTGIGDYI